MPEYSIYTMATEKLDRYILYYKFKNCSQISKTDNSAQSTNHIETNAEINEK